MKPEHKHALIIGASSGVGKALAYYLASMKYDITLCARSERELIAISSDISLKYACNIKYLCKNLDISSEINNVFSEVNINDISQVYITIGKVSDIDNGEQSDDFVLSHLQGNMISSISIIQKIIKQYNNENKLGIIVISSVATSRARQNNIIYSTAKSGLDFYCQAIQHKMQGTQLFLSVCRLGYVDTEMADGKKLLFPVAKKEKVAAALHNVLVQRKKRIFYLPTFWLFIHIIVTLLPWSIYKRLKF